MTDKPRTPSKTALFRLHERYETHDAARKIYARLLSPDAAGISPLEAYNAYAELANIYYEKGERHQAINILEEFKSGFLDYGDLFIANKVQNKLEFLRGAGFLESKPLKLEISLTDRCNLNCLMCVQRTHQCHEIKEAVYQEILGLIAYLEVINWIGGEVFMSPYFEPLFDKAALQPRLRHNIITNGLLIDGRMAGKLAKSRTFCLFSVDGVSAKTYEHVRRGARFEDMTASLSRLQKAFDAHPIADMPARLCISLVLMRCNMGDLDHLIDFARNMGVGAVRISSLQPFLPDETYQEMNIEADPKLARWFTEVVKPRLLREGLEKNVAIVGLPGFSAAAAPSGTDASRQAPAFASIPCPYPWSSFAADAEGRVRPYCHCGCGPSPEEFEANVGKHSIAEIWNGPLMRQYRRAVGAGSRQLDCARCDFAKYRFQKLFDPLW